MSWTLEKETQRVRTKTLKNLNLKASVPLVRRKTTKNTRPSVDWTDKTKTFILINRSKPSNYSQLIEVGLGIWRHPSLWSQA